MTFSSVEEIRNEFKLASDNINELHPDNNGGKFRSQEDKEKYLKISEAIEYLDKKTEKSRVLVPISEINDLIQVVKELVPQDKGSNLEEELSNKINSSITNLKSKHLLPKLTASGITAIITALWMFPSSISEHPVLKNHVDIGSNWFTVVWLFFIIATIMIWLIITKKEVQEKEYRTRLNVESIQNKLFEDYLYFESVQKGNFSKDKFIYFLTELSPYYRIHKRYYFKFFKLLRPDPIDLELAQSLANIIFVRAEEKGVIQKSNSPSLSDQYILTDAYLENRSK